MVVSTRATPGDGLSLDCPMGVGMKAGIRLQLSCLENMGFVPSRAITPCGSSGNSHRHHRSVIRQRHRRKGSPACATSRRLC